MPAGMQLARNDSQRGTIEKRTLATLENDYRKFVEDGSITSQQKFFNNVIHENLLDIDLNKVQYLLFELQLNNKFLVNSFKTL